MRPSGCFWQVDHMGALPLWSLRQDGNVGKQRSLFTEVTLCVCSSQWVLKRERLSEGPAWDPGSVFGSWEPGQVGGGFSLCPPGLGRGRGHGLNLCHAKCGLAADAEGICFFSFGDLGTSPRPTGS